jgi:uncharacterized SAM-binding protein YcdF (DUF218 family)
VASSSIPVPPRRLVAVLGYSSRRDCELHAICRARVEHGSREAGVTDVVVLTGGRHGSLGRPEADAMLEAWPGPATAVVRESAALTTAENAARAAAVAIALGVPEVVVVTSRWHSPRAALLFRWALRRTGVRVTTAPARTLSSPALLLRELACVAAVPFQLRRAGRAAG